MIPNIVITPPAVIDISVVPPPVVNVLIDARDTGGSNLPVDLAAHILDPTPHPAYDDMPSIVLVFDNHLL